MANDTIGVITCGWCGKEAHVRKASTGRKKLYVMCPGCGQQWLNTALGQDIILSNATMYGAEGAPSAPVVEPVQSVAPAAPGSGRRRSFFDLDI